MTTQNPITRALLSAIMHSTEPMVLSDPHAPDHPMIAVNKAFANLTGYPEAETLGRNCRFLQGPGTDPNTAARIRGHLQARRGCVEWIVNHRKDGTPFWNLLFLSPVFTPEGALLHYLGNQRDITQGPPVDLPDYTIGRADMPDEGKKSFQSLLMNLLDEQPGEAASARGLEKLIEAARQLDRVTLGLQPAGWEMPH